MREPASDDYERLTGARSDSVRRAWHAGVVSRFPAIDRIAHRIYGEWLRWSFAVRSMADLASYRAFRRLDGAWLGRRPGTEPVDVRLRSLGGAAVRLRPGTSDALMVRETFRDCVHPPPPEIHARGPRVILDLGANLGITVADNARRYPGAQIVAVELDPENAELARLNTAPWADRVELLQGAVWTEDGEISFERERGNEFGVRVAAGDFAGRAHTTRALSMETIISHVPEGARIDYVKMDVEGVESRLLSGPAAAWLERVDAISLQVHDPYTLDDCARDLRALGFTPRVDPRRRDYIAGVRNPRQPRAVDADFIPALRFTRLTPLFDSVAAVAVRDRAIKRRVLAHAAIARADDVLDVGCGTGTLAIAAARTAPDASVTGLDADASILARARRKAAAAGLELAFDEGRSTALPYADASFDVVLCTLFFHHLPDAAKRQTAAELVRVLRPDGRLVVGDVGSPQDPVMRLAVLATVQMLDGFATTALNVRGGLASVLTAAGLRAVTVHDRMRTPTGSYEIITAAAPKS